MPEHFVLDELVSERTSLGPFGPDAYVVLGSSGHSPLAVRRNATGEAVADHLECGTLVELSAFAQASGSVLALAEKSGHTLGWLTVCEGTFRKPGRRFAQRVCAASDEGPGTKTTLCRELLIRRDCRLDSKVIGSLIRGREMEVHDVRRTDGHVWGRITLPGGWVLMRQPGQSGPAVTEIEGPKDQALTSCTESWVPAGMLPTFSDEAPTGESSWRTELAESLPREPTVNIDYAKVGLGAGREAAAASVPRTTVFVLQKEAKCHLKAGHMGASCGGVCCICGGQNSMFKTLHCTAKVHADCLKQLWEDTTAKRGRLDQIPCPNATCSGCRCVLDELDLKGVVPMADLMRAKETVCDDRSLRFVQVLHHQALQRNPEFWCEICQVEHDLDEACTLPCGHTFCMESLSYYFGGLIRERKLELICPQVGCEHKTDASTEDPLLRMLLSPEDYEKLHKWLLLENPEVFQCRHKGCEEVAWLEVGQDRACMRCPQGHSFCADCDLGGHKGHSCKAFAVAKKSHQERLDDANAWQAALREGWKPCPMRCAHGGGYKSCEECDHVTCTCGFEFCWDCGVDRRLPLAHDNRWHKPACRYHTPHAEVKEVPRRSRTCPECQKLASGCCAYPVDDGYPQSYIQEAVCLLGRRQAPAKGLCPLEVPLEPPDSRLMLTSF